MTSSKKMRGKQRKAAKNLAAAARARDSGASNNNGRNRGVNIFALSPSEMVERVKKGCKHATIHLSMFERPDISLESSGILLHVLSFLKRCEHETLGQVMADVGGDMFTPFTWMRLLTKVVHESEPSRRIPCQLTIAQNIGPLVSCMCNDTRRLFFQSKEHWVGSIAIFVGLITDLIDSGEDTIIDVLFRYEGLLGSIIQWGFWGEEYRPDITKELDCPLLNSDDWNSNDRTNIVTWGRKYAELLVIFCVKNRDKNCLETIGTTPIVSKQYDPSCMVSYTEGVLRLMKTEGWKLNDFRLLRTLIERADCVDKGVITEIIDLGLKYTRDYDIAESVVEISCDMLLQETNREKCCPSDARVAFAIHAGLIEMCLSFIEQFGMIESFGNVEQNISLATILKMVHTVSLHMKSAKAIRQKKTKIEEELFRLEQKSEISNSVECKELLDIVRSILDLNGAYCCRCNKLLERKDIKQCNGCHRMTYCSKACQREDWVCGHKLACNKSYTDEEAGRFQGRDWPETMPESERAAIKMEALEINITMIQLKLFLDNAETILNQARSLNIPLHDCIILFDFRYCPLSVEVQRYSEFYKSQEERRGFEESRSKQNITCIYYSAIFNGELLSSGVSPFMAMQRFYPHEWLSKKLKFLPETMPECERAVAKLKELEVNNNMIQLKLLLDNSEHILSQARSLGSQV